MSGRVVDSPTWDTSLHPNRSYVDKLMALWAQDPRAFCFPETERSREAWDNTIVKQNELLYSVEYGEVSSSTSLFDYRNGMYNALTCLSVYDDCSYMLESDPAEIELLAALGDDKALLLLPACRAFHKYRDIVNKEFSE